MSSNTRSIVVLHLNSIFIRLEKFDKTDKFDLRKQSVFDIRKKEREMLN